MDITPFVPADRQLVIGYGDLGFTITKVRYEGSVLVFPDRVLAWPLTSFAELTVDSLAPVLAAQPRPTILIIGCGKGMQAVPRELRATLRAEGVVIEAMDTGAACRTYNVLMAEGRDVAGAFIAV